MSRTVVNTLGFALLVIIFKTVPVSMAEPFIPVIEGRWTTEKPKIDGRLDDPCWQGITPVGTFWLADGSSQRKEAAQVWLAYDNTAIYIAYRIKSDRTSGLGSGSKVRDIDAWGGPHVQIFLQPGKKTGYFDFIVNSANTQQDGKDFMETWNGTWESAVTLSPDFSFWQVEVAIPYATLCSGETLTSEWRGNFTCGVVLAGKTDYLTWAPTFGNFHCPPLFGKLILKNIQGKVIRSSPTTQPLSSVPKDIPAFEAWLDRSLYTTQSEARLTVQANRRNGTGQSCKVILPDGKEMTRPFNSHSRAVFTLPLDRFCLGRQELKIIPDRHQPVLCPLTKLKPQPGTVHYDDRGVLYKDENIFFPIGMYYFREFLGKDDGLLEEATQAGFNTLIEDWVDYKTYIQDLKAWAPKKMNVIACISTEYTLYQMSHVEKAPAKNLEGRVATVVKSVTDSSPTNLIAWYIDDEPGISTFALVQRWSKLTAHNDPRRPTLVTVWSSNLYRLFSEIVDILCIDPYPGFPGGNLMKVPIYTEQARQAVRGRKPVVVVIQTFGEPAGNPKGLMPTPAEIRCQTYLALVREARGILFFSYSYNGPMKTAHPEHWKEMKRLATEIRDLASILVDASGDLQATQTRIASPILTRLIQHENIAYMLAVNPARTKVANVQWQTRGFQDGVVEVVGENRSVELKNGKFCDHFEPLDVHVYRQINLK